MESAGDCCMLEIKVPAKFDLRSTFFSYGWALLAPNCWTKDQTRPEGFLRRNLSLEGGHNANVCISQEDKGGKLAVRVVRVEAKSLTAGHRGSASSAIWDNDKVASTVEQQVIRMLRLTKSDTKAVNEFQKLHPQAKKEKFGRLLRSPTVWEDVVKCILLCNCGWGRTISMNAALCQEIGDGGFPTALQLSSQDPAKLQAACGLGYRAKSIVSFAQRDSKEKVGIQVVKEEIDLTSLEDTGISDEDLLEQLKGLPGVGPFSANNVLQLLGRYSKIACDSETVRHLQSYHKLTKCTSANVTQLAGEVYDRYAPYQFLAYWHEMWRSYESLRGPFADLSPEDYKSFTGSNMKRGCQTPASGNTVQKPQGKKSKI